jgi:uncharacterized protein YbjT (DUF2867 family)
MRVVIAGGHGKIARRLERLLSQRGDDVIGLIRDPGHSDDLRVVGAKPVLCDLEQASLEELVPVLHGADAAVFAAGAGPGSGAARKDSVDRAAAVLLADAAQSAGVRRHLLISSMGVDRAADGGPRPGSGDVFAAYLRAKAAAEQEVRQRDLDWTILRPGRLTDDPGTGRVRLAAHVDPGRVPRDDVAAVLLALLDEPTTSGLVLELVSGHVPTAEAVAALRR